MYIIKAEQEIRGIKKKQMKDQNHKKAIILIPAFEPDQSLLSYVNALQEHGLLDIIIVDDGSGADYQPTFQELQLNVCTVLHHPVNCGKGRALKTGFQYIEENYNQFACVVTADADGQHAVKDVLRILELAEQNPHALSLGVRDFTTPGIPLRSLLGNRVTSLVFAALYGRRLCDTQTGLRAFGKPLLSFMLAVKGERFEYELQMLIACVRANIPMCTLPIQVIYVNSNEATHFQPFHDSVRIAVILLSGFLRFSASSLISSAVDLGIVWFLLDFLRTFFQSKYMKVLAATSIARVISIVVNYILNQNFVFRRKMPGSKTLLRYLLLCILIILLSATGVYALHRGFGINEKIGKIIVDSSLFLLSYHVQRQWVFAVDSRNNTIYEEG